MHTYKRNKLKNYQIYGNKHWNKAEFKQGNTSCIKIEKKFFMCCKLFEQFNHRHLKKEQHNLLNLFVQPVSG